LEILDKWTVFLGKELREFSLTTCSAFTTWELQREANVRNRRQAKQSARAEKDPAVRPLTSASRTINDRTPADKMAEASSTDKSESGTKGPGASNTRKRQRVGGTEESQKRRRTVDQKQTDRKSRQSVQAAKPQASSSAGPSRSTTEATGTGKDLNTAVQVNAGRQQKQFNLNTYKHHALGDVANTIRRYGTTDSYSTEPVSLTFDSSAYSM
jgi:hypothetical protein